MGEHANDFVEHSEDIYAQFESEHEAALERRGRRLAKVQDTVIRLRESGFSVRECSPYHYQINKVLQWYPSWRKWHNAATGERGITSNILVTAREQVQAKQ